MKNSQQHIFRQVLLVIMFVSNPFFILWGSADEKNLGLRTVCIDAGHGGKDPGCISKDGSKTKEKNITLSIAGYLAKSIRGAYPEIKVVMTRSDDRFIELGERAGIANRNGADLFISIHVNSVDSRGNRGWASVKGFSIHTLGQSRTGKDLFSFNMEVCKRENSVILLEDDYTTKYQGFNPSEPESYIFFNLMQNANLGHSLDFAEEIDKQMKKGPIKNSRGLSQDPFYVLWKTTMPAVLIEVGFITNTSDLAVMKTEEGRKAIANRIFQAFTLFKKKYDASLNVNSNEILPSDEKVMDVDGKDSLPAQSNNSTIVASNVEGIKYGTQIFATGKKLPANDKVFKGYTPIIIKGTKIYKYIIGVSDNIDEAKRQNKTIKKIFPESFLVVIENGETSMLK